MRENKYGHNTKQISIRIAMLVARCKVGIVVSPHSRWKMKSQVENLAQGHLATKPGFDLGAAVSTLSHSKRSTEQPLKARPFFFFFFWMKKRLGDITKVSDSDAIQAGTGETSRTQIHTDAE